MKCEFNYCVYNREQICILNEIKINSFGICEPCEMIDIPNNIIEKHKNKRLKEIKKIWNDYDSLPR